MANVFTLTRSPESVYLTQTGKTVPGWNIVGRTTGTPIPGTWSRSTALSIARALNRAVRRANTRNPNT